MPFYRNHRIKIFNKKRIKTKIKSFKSVVHMQQVTKRTKSPSDFLF